MKNPIPSEFIQKLAPAFDNFYNALFEPDADYRALFNDVMKSVETFRVFYIAQLTADALSKSDNDTQSEV